MPMRKHACRRLLLLALSALMLSACSSTPQEPQLNGTPQSSGLSGPVVEQRWNLLLVGTDERLSFAEAPFFTISRDGKVAGFDGCNRFTGHVSLGESQRIDFEGLATTRMACSNLADAKRVTDMLDSAYRYLIDHDRLVFFGPDSRVLGGWREGK
ncbi:META domain-containing protein [Halomonas aquamarina]|uniref:META domain-containing protein n=1 Tax=Vreelandella aquamarina TaxID=77097 RepID=A0ACC5VTU4_9GAMM|nr:META domain-containing protein [Halomonas aquamarina]MBZ5487077.1 META domain-containing protein [Halomonas aquamarina]